ncbi:MAG TPA: hypothetical protein VMF08_10430 [Candidatus Sulfotelmatobacter sp.]|nr:hypothetical protein [Candidatus Sulfotelmatobacter sp.]
MRDILPIPKRRPPCPDQLPGYPHVKTYWDPENKLWYRLDPIQDREDSADDSKLLEKLEARIFSPAKNPIEPKPRFYLADVGICTPGNVTTMAAQAKAGKTAVVGAMIASAFGNDGNDYLSFRSENPNSYAFIHLDTEQSPFDHWQLIDRARRRTRASIPKWLMSYCVTSLSSKEIRASIPLLLNEAKKKFGGVHSLIFDGAADAVADVNDACEANEFVAELHALAIEYDCPIVCVIHLNPGSERKTRGHLGSQLERKSETNLQVDKDTDDVSTIWADRNRRRSIPKKSAPCFAWSDDAQMHVSVENPAEAKAEAKSAGRAAAMQQDAQMIFAKGETLQFKDALSAIEKHFALKNAGARRRLENWQRAGIIKRPDAGSYALAK